MREQAIMRIVEAVLAHMSDEEQKMIGVRLVTSDENPLWWLAERVRGLIDHYRDQLHAIQELLESESETQDGINDC